jgi:ABC-type transport system involved in Fe-S cluster assembly fused permease/ATPase subunit
MIYNAIVQAVVDLNEFMILLLTVPDVLDEEGATDIPLLKSMNEAKYEIPCQTCRRKLEIDWLCCPFCRLEIDRASLVPKKSGVSVEFRSTQFIAFISFTNFLDIRFNYPSQPSTSGLKGISFFCPPGTTTAIVGHSGSGKTTVSRLLYRFYDPSAGEILLGGYNIQQYTQQSIRKCIGIVPQDTVLFNDSLLYNIQYGNLEASRAEVERVAESAKIRDFIESLPNKWETQVGERGLKLSGGEKQRISIARCLVNLFLLLWLLLS